MWLLMFGRGGGVGEVWVLGLFVERLVVDCVVLIFVFDVSGLSTVHPSLCCVGWPSHEVYPSADKACVAKAGRTLSV